VLVDEVLAHLAPTRGETILDLTVGAGGHAERVLGTLAPEGKLIGCDRDPAILRVAREVLAPFGACAVLRVCRSDSFRAILQELGIPAVHGVLMDLGVSSLQLDEAARGFSFRSAGPLDMRMTGGEGPTARDLILRLAEPDLARIFFRYGEEPKARRIAAALKALPRQSVPRTTTELAEFIAEIVPSRQPGRAAIHPATRVFQALRIAVNDELGVLERTLPLATEALHPGGRLVVISFHSLEDRIVKDWFREQCREGVFASVAKKPAVASEAEVARNPRARSAKLRFAVKASMERAA
jgi:16S rRNA (cytosine1402-N4)-methyltransferase